MGGTFGSGTVRPLGKTAVSGPRCNPGPVRSLGTARSPSRMVPDTSHSMTQGNDRQVVPPRGKRHKPDAAFDQWLTRGLHQMFDAVASEPIPEELLKLIEDDIKA